ncbi:MAG: FAD-dependent oxidoreductase [Actinomycetaceae bacterium]|nr:FAD-dependent oxidoreductase [Actinomycetaceae bacterium]
MYRKREADIVIIGGGLAGLTAAYQAVKKGITPILLEERGRPGGLVCSGAIGDVTIDIGAESYAIRTPTVSQLCKELGLETVKPQGSSWIWTHKNGGYPVPIPHGIFGIPADIKDPLFTSTLVNLAGEQALERAQRDLSMPTHIGSKCKDLGSLVEMRLGRAVLDNFVTPFAGGIHGAHPSQLSLDVVTPGLREKIRQEGSLIGAVHAMRPHPVPVVEQTKGGMYRLVEALRDAIIQGGGKIENRTHALSIVPGMNHRWSVWHTDTQSNPDPHQPPILVKEKTGIIETDKIIIATPSDHALKLLGTAADEALLGSAEIFNHELTSNIIDTLDGFTLPKGSPIAHYTLVVRDSALDSGPRGSGMLVTPAERGDTARVRAKALTHYSYKWPDTVTGTPEHTHVLRVSYGRAGEDLSYVTLEQALRDASTMLGITIDHTNLVDSRLIHWDGSLAPHTPESREKVKRLLELIDQTKGIDLAGAWIAGSGIEAVIRHSQTLI